jgi:hypothetical protein
MYLLVPWSNVTKLCLQFGTYALFYIFQASLCTSLVSPLIGFTVAKELDLLCLPSLPHCNITSDVLEWLLLCGISSQQMNKHFIDNFHLSMCLGME